VVSHAGVGMTFAIELLVEEQISSNERGTELRFLGDLLNTLNPIAIPVLL
jgi:hypothetical protein